MHCTGNIAWHVAKGTFLVLRFDLQAWTQSRTQWDNYILANVETEVPTISLHYIKGKRTNSKGLKKSYQAPQSGL